MKSFTPLILIIIVIATFFMYMKPTFGEIQILSTEKSTYTDILQKAKELSSKRDTILTQYNAVSPADIERLKKIIPENYDSIAIAKHINTIASKYGVIIKAIKVAEPTVDSREMVITDSNRFKSYAVSFSFSSSYDQFTKFIKDIESGLLLMEITKISIGSEAKGNEVKGQGSNISTTDYGIGLITYSFN